MNSKDDAAIVQAITEPSLLSLDFEDDCKNSF